MNSLNKICYACKQSNEIIKGKPSDLLYFDGHFYHKECFKDLYNVRKTCYHCHKDIVITCEDDIDSCNLVYYDKHYFDKDCFIKYCNAHKQTKKWKFALDHVDKFIIDAKDEIKLSYNKRIKSNNVQSLNNEANKQINRIFKESEVNDYIKDTYSVKSISTMVWRRLDAIYKGTFKIDVPIPPEHLKDMWKRKQRTLDKIYNDNIRKGNEFTIDQRILYDLSVLTGRYESYLSWVKKQKYLEQENKNKKLSDIDLQLVGVQAAKQQHDKENENQSELEAIVDEIFN